MDASVRHFRPRRPRCFPLDLIDKIINGIPVPGDGLRWRYCPVMPGVLPANITDITRPSDTEGIDYHSIVMEIKETGDA